jgi:hypothetical protein
VYPPARTLRVRASARVPRMEPSPTPCSASSRPSGTRSRDDAPAAPVGIPPIYPRDHTRRRRRRLKTSRGPSTRRWLAKELRDTKGGLDDTPGWMREFYASCDAEDLKIGDMGRFLDEYRRAVGAQALGSPPDLSPGADEHMDGVNSVSRGTVPARVLGGVASVGGRPGDARGASGRAHRGRVTFVRGSSGDCG